MRAAICREFGAPLLVETAELVPPGRGQVELQLASCAICHSDLAYAAGAWGGTLPAVYGHEAAGWVVAAAPEAADLRPGEPVLVTLIRACGDCAACHAEDPTSCTHAWDARRSPVRDATGAILAQGMNTAAFAERVVVDRSQCVALPPDLDLDLACLLACGVLTGVGAVRNTAKVPAGASVAVIGAGGVGLNVIQGARLAGASPIIAIDTNPAQLDRAGRFGATTGVAAGADTAAAVRRANGGAGVDFAFVGVGVAAVIAATLDLLAPGGVLVIVGMPPSGASVDYDPGALAALNLTIAGSRMGRSLPSRDIPRLIADYRAGGLILDELIVGRYGLDEINAACASSAAGVAGRNLIVY